jgi:adenine-specific DNA-methyltransferase
MRYIGGKTLLLDKIKTVVDVHCSDTKPDAKNKIFCDLFSGTGVVARFFKQDYQIIANDMLYFPYIVTCAGIENNTVPSFLKLRKTGIIDPITFLDTLKSRSLKNCFIAKNYSPHGEAKRMYLSKENALRIDIIRQQIEIWKNDSLLTGKEYRYLLASLLEGVPFISNITGTYGAYLKHWDKRALKRFSMAHPNVIDNGRKNICYNQNANELIKKISGDILYIDPPYNTRQYLPNYHVLETIARYDAPEILGVTGLRPYNDLKSDYCIKQNAESAFESLIMDADFKHIIISYSDDGLLKPKTILDILNHYCKGGKAQLITVPYLRYKGKQPQQKKEHNEYIFYAQKQTKKILFNNIIGASASINNSTKKEKSILQKKQFIKSPMNYIGGKYKILPQLFEHFPHKIDTFLDLFAGGFNVSVNVNTKKTLCNDMNHKVVNMVHLFCNEDIDAILHRINEKINEYKLSKDNEHGYKAFRNYYNATGNPIDLFTLSCFSFNYQFRFNNNLEFNNPFGRNRSYFSQVTKQNLILFIEEMRRKNLKFYANDFREISLRGLGKNDFIYCDPPYLITTGTYNDGKRGFHDWTETEEKDLYATLDEANKNNIRFALSNVFVHKNQENRILKNWAKKYRIHYINADYSNCNYQAKQRNSKTIEVLVTNY